MIQLEKNEKIIAIFRKHWIALLGEIVGMGLMVFLPFLIFTMFYNSVFSYLSSTSLFTLLFFYILLLIGIWIFGYVTWINHYLDMWILTDRRLIDIDQQGLFSREISSLHLEKIQDVKIEVHGVLRTLLKVGEVHVQTSAAQREFVIQDASHPQKLKHLIMRVHTDMLDRVRTVRIHTEDSSTL